MFQLTQQAAVYNGKWYCPRPDKRHGEQLAQEHVTLVEHLANRYFPQELVEN